MMLNQRRCQTKGCHTEQWRSHVVVCGCSINPTLAEMTCANRVNLMPFYMGGYPLNLRVYFKPYEVVMHFVTGEEVTVTKWFGDEVARHPEFQ